MTLTVKIRTSGHVWRWLFVGNCLWLVMAWWLSGSTSVRSLGAVLLTLRTMVAACASALHRFAGHNREPLHRFFWPVRAATRSCRVGDDHVV